MVCNFIYPCRKTTFLLKKRQSVYCLHLVIYFPPFAPISHCHRPLAAYEVKAPMCLLQRRARLFLLTELMISSRTSVASIIPTILTKMLILVSPQSQTRSPTLSEIMGATTPQGLNEAVAKYPLDLSAPTDDRPFFFNQLRIDPASVWLAHHLAGCGKSGILGPDMGYYTRCVTRCGGASDARWRCQE